MDISRFEQFWLAEHQRLRDVDDPDLQQAQYKFNEISALQPQEQLLQRAIRLSERQGLLSQLQHWQHLRRLITFIFAAVAVLIGVGVSQTLLSQPQPISLLFAVNVLLLPNLLMLMFWLLFTLRRQRPSGISGLAYALLSLLQRKRGEHALEQSWLRHVRQQRVMQPLMALATHGFWFLLSLSAWLTLLLYLSFNVYSFQWATTILADHQVQGIAQAINTLPALIFNAQLPTLVESSLHTTIANEAGRWLTLCLLTYGVLPRALAALIAAGLFFWRTRAMRLDLQANGNHGVIRAVQSAQQSVNTVDADASNEAEGITFVYASEGSGYVSLTLDYEAAPQAQQNDNYLGVVATHAEKQQLLQRLRQSPSAHLQVCVAAQLTPDRSSLRYLAELARTTKHLSVILIGGAQATYVKQWQQQLDNYGVDYVLA